MSDDYTIPFTPEAVRDFLDECIRQWRLARTGEDQYAEMAPYYIDALQSVRTSLFGETLPLPEEKQ